MSDANHGSDQKAAIPASVIEAVNGLCAATESPVTRNELGRLAQMHMRCEELLAAAANHASAALESANAIAGALMRLVEAVILDEAADAENGVTQIPTAAQTLLKLTAGELVDAGELLRQIELATTGVDLIPAESPPQPAVMNFEEPAPAPSASEASLPEPLLAAVARLKDIAASGPKVTDLGRLAQMHTCCEEIGAASKNANSAAAAASQDLARALAGVLGGVILDEVKDADKALELVGRSVAAFEALTTGNTADCPALVAELSAMLIDGATVIEESEPAPSSPAPAPEMAAPAPAPAPTPRPAAKSSVKVDEYVSVPLVVDLEDRESLQGFIDESREHIDAIETALLDVEQNPTDADKINELFRPFHTIKGIAGFLNLRDINCLTHEAETILDMGRKGTMKITPVIIDLIFGGIDVLKSQINALAAYVLEPTSETCPQPPCAEMILRLRRAAAGDLPEEAASAPAQRVEEAAQQSGGGAQAAESKTNGADLSIRVDTSKLDYLVDTVGELVIAQTMVNLHSAVDTSEDLRRAVSQVTKIVRDVQEASMAMRMVPVGNTFQKMKRVVRDVSRKAGKQVELLISGEETELDKNVIQQIADPLVHMVRNAVDHGIEPSEKRLSANKPGIGRVWLDAYHEGDNVVIEIRDDGAGLDPKKLIAKGVERGVVSADDQLTDKQAFGLIMAAGFSTAAKVTDISGRGVGMDVVKRNIEELRGKISIDSVLGQGSTFKISLPLTLAIIDGMIIRIGQERVVVPTILIEQSLRPERSALTSVQRRGEMLSIRGELCPLVQIGQLFGYTSRVDPCGSLVVIANAGGQKIGMVVDELVGQQQVVIKSLGERFKQVNGVSGAAILGDGRVGLILEPAGILRLHNQTEAPPLPSISAKAIASATESKESSELVAEQPEAAAATA